MESDTLELKPGDVLRFSGASSATSDLEFLYVYDLNRFNPTKTKSMDAYDKCGGRMLTLSRAECLLVVAVFNLKNYVGVPDYQSVILLTPRHGMVVAYNPNTSLKKV